MRKLNYELGYLVRHAREGSFATQAARSRILAQCAQELNALGFKHLAAKGLKTKHVDALVKHWLGRDLTAGTIKNRMVHLRWWAEKIGRPGVVRIDNASYGIARRHFVTNIDKSRTLNERVAQIADPYVRLSLALQAAFGLRREEAIKFQPAYADRGDKIVLKAGWTKGGKVREVPIREASQRAVLDEARRFVGRGSLIPADKKYVAHLRVYENQTNRAGLSRLHGLRHAYAQSRYQVLTGWPAPVRGGLRRKDMTVAQQVRDRDVRLVISRELGHERLEIVAVYLGS